MNVQTINQETTPPQTQTAATQTEEKTPPVTADTWNITLDKDFADILKPQADKLKEYGLSPEHAQKIVDDATKEMKANMEAMAADDKAFEQKYGGAEKVKEVKDLALKAMEKVGVSQEEARAITKIFGSNKVYEVFYKIAQQMGADTFKNFSGSGVVYQPGNMTPDQAAVEAKRLQSDPEFMAKIANDDKEAVARLENLFNIQHGVRK